MTAVIGLGTNIGNRKENIGSAVDALKLVPGVKVKRVSSLYETEPWGYKDQPDFYNCAVEVETTLSPEALLGVCLGIEAGMGRVRNIKNGPRIMDLDLLLYEDVHRDTDELRLPHPRIKERDFVILPLAELYPAHSFGGFDFSAEAEKYKAESTAEKL